MNYRGDVVVRYLARTGHRVTLICSFSPELRDPRNRIQGVEYEFVSPYRKTKRPFDLVFRMVQLGQLIVRTRRLVRRSRYDVIRTISLLPTVAAICADRSGGIPIVSNLSDFYSDLYVQFDLPFSRSAKRVLERLEHVLLERADAIIVDTKVQRSYFTSDPALQRKIVAIPHGIPRSLPGGGERSTGLRGGHSASSPGEIVFYIGDVSKLDGLDILVDAACLVREVRPNARFLVVGSGTKRYMASLWRKIEAEHLEAIFTFIEHVPNREVPSLLATAGVCVAPFRLTKTSDSSIPNKILEYLSEKRPVVATAGRGVRTCLGDAVYFVPPEEPSLLADAIVRTLSGQWPPSASQERVENLVSSLSWERLLEREVAVLDAVVHGESRDLSVFDYLPA